MRRRETWALVLLTIGFFAGPIAWVAGWVLTAQSRRWNARQKIAAAVLPGVMLLALVPVVLIASQTGCDSQPGSADSCDPGSPPIIVWPLAVIALVVLVSLLVPLIRAARRPG